MVKTTLRINTGCVWPQDQNSLPSFELLRFVAQVGTQILHPFPRRPIPSRPRGWTQTLVALQENGEVSAVAESCPPDSQVLHESEVLDLVPHYGIFKHIWWKQQKF